jgi:hypothetical protein
MALYSPVYRMTVYRYRSWPGDATETVALTPAAGAPHSDSFKVATKTGMAGFQPYMDLPEGRRGRLDLLIRKLDQGQLTVRLLDTRTTAGGSNLSRWVTAFTGNTSGAPQLLGLKVLIEESTDGGTGWANYFMGRISAVNLDNPLKVTLSIRDTSADLNYEVFVGRFHTSATGAGEPYVLPPGSSIAYGTLPAVTRLAGVFNSSSVWRTITLATGATGPATASSSMPSPISGSGSRVGR